VAIVLIWVYYSAQILFLGAEFAQVYAKHRRESAQRAPEKQRRALALPELSSAPR